ncbi:YciI family protein [Silvimonas sp.]|uniref:YciI family protein n=1 Tax=Silvimonas sp. TaxID=2650811 RepID=UPI00284F5C39|nr:YciI family protein [Silvimonas sp.]MDR3428534.1 YciI family protein [Silvimonas sp.]
MFLLNVSYSQNPAAVEPHIASHGAWVKQYVEAGVFVAAGPKRNGLGGVILAQVASRAQLDDILAQDSYVMANVATYQIEEFDFKITQPEVAALKAV